MMIFGMLYFDWSYKLSEEELVVVARTAFERKSNSKATLALLNLSSDGVPEIAGLKVVRSHLVRSHHTIVGVPVN